MGGIRFGRSYQNPTVLLLLVCAKRKGIYGSADTANGNGIPA